MTALGRLVVDCTVAIKWFVTEPHSLYARIILSQYQTGHLNLIAPDSIFAEMANIVWRKHTAQQLAVGDGQMILNTFRALRITVFPSHDLLDDAFQLAVRHKQSVHAMLYLALSQREHCKYVTADEQFVKPLNGTFADMVALADWK